MNKTQLLEILEEWNFWKKELDTGKKRDKYLVQSLSFLKPNVVLTIIGLRRSGKSYLMKQIAKELTERGVAKDEILIVNLEDRRFFERDIKLLDQIFETYLEVLKPKTKPYIFLDEIQKIPQWERWVRTFHELNKAKIIVSGSSAKLLYGELATVLTGRHLDVVVFPLSFKEFLMFKGLDIKDKLDLIAKRIEIKGFFNEYLEFGGFPEVVLNEDKTQLLLTYFDDILTKDIEKRYNLRKTEKLRTLARFYLTNISNPISFNSLKKFLEISPNTVEKFSSYLEEAYLIFFVNKFSYKLKEQEKAARKVYSSDIGLAKAIGFRFTENKGFAAENIVALELKRKQSQNLSMDIYYWRDLQGHEVDFLVKEGLKVTKLFQVCWNLDNFKTKEREIKSLIKASKELKVNNLLIITEDYESEETINKKKIKFIPLWKWLLEEE
ncbi:ATP-binding protein [Candidatus Woesearchaeota archaeon]|nr:ATP-binding protein [Candidatus Woesearchaeota archaeon]